MDLFFFYQSNLKWTHKKDRSTDRGRQVKAPLPNARLPRQFRVSDSLRTTEMPLEAPQIQGSLRDHQGSIMSRLLKSLYRIRQLSPEPDGHSNPMSRLCIMGPSYLLTPWVNRKWQGHHDRDFSRHNHMQICPNKLRTKTRCSLRLRLLQKR